MAFDPDKRSLEKKKEFHDLPIPGMVTPDDRKKKQKASKKNAKEQITPSMALMSPQERKENDEKLRLMLGRYDAAKLKRIHYNKIWNDISTYIVPSLNNNFNISTTAATGYSQDAISTYIRNSNLVYDATAIIACNKIAGALYSFTNNPSLKWYQYDLPISKDPSYQAVKKKRTTKEWLNRRRDVTIQYLNKAMASCSNTLYNEAIGYGTSSIFLRETFDSNIMIGKCISLETLYIGEDENGIVNTIFREFELSATNAVSKFGAENVHPEVLKDSEHKPDALVKYVHVCAPNKWAILDSEASKDKPFLDIYIDLQNKVIVHHSGFDEFPYGIARMNVPSNAPYGVSPGMMVLPDVKTVNVFEKINIDVGNKAGTPPMHMMVDNYVTPFSMVPGAINLYNDPQGMAQPLQTVGNVNIMENALERKKAAIKEGFFNDLLTPAKGHTTYEVQEEQLLQMKLMAPWQGGFELELYEPLIRRAEGILDRVGNVLPEAPEDVLALYPGKKLPPLTVIHTSPLSLAQKQSVLQAIDRTIQFAGGLAALGGMDSIEVAKTISYYAETSGMPHDLYRDPEEAKKITDARAKVQAEAAQKEAMTEEAKQAKLLAGASKDTGGMDGLMKMMGAGPAGQGVPTQGTPQGR